VTTSTFTKPSILLADSTKSERKSSPQVIKKNSSEGDDIFAMMGLSADTTSLSSSRSATKTADSTKIPSRWSSALSETRGSPTAISVSNRPVIENEIKSNWDDADDELAALLDDD
jgi:hypothetical protein